MLTVALLDGSFHKGSYILLSEGKSIIAEIRCRLKDSFGPRNRNTLGWSICLYFVNQVC